MNISIAGFLNGIISRYKGSAVDWLEENFVIPHSARNSKFDRETAPHLTDIIEACCDIEYKKVVVRACTGAGKTTVMEAVTLFAIGAEPGPMLIVGQSDEDIKDWSETRLLPELRLCPPIAKTLGEMNRHDKRKTEIIFPHMSLFMTGANMSGLQAKSIRYCYGDETWIWKKGMIGEMKARHHDRWNQKTILVSQGWETDKEDPHDMDGEYEEGDDCRRGWTCPKCKTWQEYKLEGIIWEKVMIEGSEQLNYDATAKTVKMKCVGETCGAEYPDTSETRRRIATSGSYRPMNPHHMDRVKSFTCPAMAVWWIPWGDLVIEWLKAIEAKRRGDIELFKRFKMKREAQVFETVHVRVTDEDVMAMRDPEYTKGECPIDPVALTLAADPAQAQTHWSIMAWTDRGEGYVIDYGKVISPDDLIKLARERRYIVRGTQKEVSVFQGLVDSGDFTEDIYYTCLRSESLLFPSKGSGATEGNKPWRETILDTYAHLPLYTYLDAYFKTELYERKIANKEHPRLHFPSDADEEFLKGHMGQRRVSSNEAGGKKWRKVLHDHYGDCSKLHMVAWFMLRQNFELK